MPVPSGQLLQHAPYMGVGGIRGQGENGICDGVHQRFCSLQSVLGRLEGCGGRPLQRLGVPSECVGKGLKRAGDIWKEASVKVHHT